MTAKTVSVASRRSKGKGVRAFYDLLWRPMTLQFLYLLTIVLGAPLIFMPGDASLTELWHATTFTEPMAVALWRISLIMPAALVWLYISATGQVIGTMFSWCLPGIRRFMFIAQLHLLFLSCAAVWFMHWHFHQRGFSAVAIGALTFAAVLSLGTGPRFLKWYWLFWILALARPLVVLPFITSHMNSVGLVAGALAVWLTHRLRTADVHRIRMTRTVDFSMDRGWFARLFFGPEPRRAAYALVRNRTYDWYRAVTNARTPRRLGFLMVWVWPAILFGLLSYLIRDTYFLCLVIGFTSSDTLGLQGGAVYPLSRDRRVRVAFMDYAVSTVALIAALAAVVALFELFRPLAGFLSVRDVPLRNGLASTLLMLLIWLPFARIAAAFPPVRDLGQTIIQGGTIRTFVAFMSSFAIAGAAFWSIFRYRDLARTVDSSTLFGLGILLMMLTHGIGYVAVRYGYRTRDLI